MRDQRDVYRQSWVRQHVNPSEPMSLIMLVLSQFDSCNTSAYDFGGRVFDEDNVSTLQFDSCNTSAYDFEGRVSDEDNVSTLTV